VHWVRTVSICVFKVKYDGREIPCDYTDRFYPDISNVNKNITLEAKLTAHLRTMDLRKDI